MMQADNKDYRDRLKEKHESHIHGWYFNHFHNIFGFIFFGVVILHLRTIFFLIFRNSPQSQVIDDAIQLIELGKKQGLPEWQTKQMYVELFRKYINSAELKTEFKSELVESKNPILEERPNTEPTLPEPTPTPVI